MNRIDIKVKRKSYQNYCSDFHNDFLQTNDNIIHRTTETKKLRIISAI